MNHTWVIDGDTARCTNDGCALCVSSHTRKPVRELLAQWNVCPWVDDPLLFARDRKALPLEDRVTTSIRAVIPGCTATDAVIAARVAYCQRCQHWTGHCCSDCGQCSKQWPAWRLRIATGACAHMNMDDGNTELNGASTSKGQR